MQTQRQQMLYARKQLFPLPGSSRRSEAKAEGEGRERYRNLFSLSRSLFSHFIFTLLFFFLGHTHSQAQDNLIWGTSTITLKSSLLSSPTLNDLLTNPTKSVSLNHFYLAGGENRPATPTECRIACDKDNLFVLFRCSETNLDFPATSHGEDWYSLLRSPSEQDAAFPDKVDLFIQPDLRSREFYQFAAMPDGSKFGCRHGLPSKSDEPTQTDEESATAISSRITKITTFTATVTKGTNEWLVLFSIPWKTIGGKPSDYFGLLPFRTRWRDGEVSSPVAMDFNERPPIDLFIETHFAGTNPIKEFPQSLIQLPSGVQRWQRPALLSYPGPDIVRQIWQFQQSLSKLSDTNNFARRLYLTQRWVDLLTIEGFNSHSGTGGVVQHEMAPYLLRRNINIALRDSNFKPACDLLDAYLKKLDQYSRDWFADSSPGDILQEEWKSVSKLENLAISNNVLHLRCLAKGHSVNIHLSLPESGGIRICGDAEGYFKPASLCPLEIIKTNSLSFSTHYMVVSTNGLWIIINDSPFTIILYDSIYSQAIVPNGLAFLFNQQNKVIATDFNICLQPNETIFGFGERYDHFSQTGHILTLWGTDDWIGNTVGLLNQTYKPIPIFHSSCHYMVFDNSSYRLRADVGKTRQDLLRLTQQGPVFDYYFWIGSPSKALESYTGLTGKPVLPPKWAFEPWMGRTGRGWNKPSNNMVAEEESVTKQFEKLDIPHSAIYAEGGGNAESPELNRFMAARGIKVLSWFYPVISEATQAKLMPEMKSTDLPVLRTWDPWDHVDFTNPNALELMRRVWSQRLNVGVAGSMIDFGDRVTEDAIFHNGKRGNEMHNFYSYDYHRTCAEAFRQKRGGDFILFGRAAAPGTQKWVAQFAGDHPANFKGLQSVLTGALNLCSCGFSTWGSDLGGFLGWPEPAVYMRWTQFACFSPLMRCHGRTPREPWNYGDDAVANYKYYAWVRENLLNYIYDSAIKAHETGTPMIRSMAIAFPNDTSLATADDQYMFGPDLLVAPVTDENNSRVIRFPSGQWASLWSGKLFSGPVNIHVDVPLDTIPVYLKSGAIIPVQLNPSLQFGTSMSRGRVNALLVMPPPGNGPASSFNEQAPNAKATLRRLPSGLEIDLKNDPDTNFLLIFNLKADTVKIDGRLLPKITDGKPESMPPGWYADSQMNRTVIKLHAQPNGHAAFSPPAASCRVEILVAP